MGNFGTFEFCALKLGNVPNLYAQKLIVPKYCQGLKKVYKFGKVPNLNTQIRQVAKFVRTNLAHCQICTLLQGRGKKVYKFGKVPNLCAQFWHFARFVRGPLLNNYNLPLRRWSKAMWANAMGTVAVSFSQFSFLPLLGCQLKVFKTCITLI